MKLVIVVIALFFNLSFTIAQTSDDTVVAKKGEGIYALLRNSGMNPVEYYSDFVALNKEDLRNGKHLYAGKTYKIPKINTKFDTDKKPETVGVGYPIFGKKYATVERQSNKLKGTVYYLISGHGGPDPGAIAKHSKNIIAEDEYAYDITLRLGRELISHGALVYIIIRDTDGIRDDRLLKVDHDEVCYPKQTIPLNQVARLKQRVEVVNDLYLKNRGMYQRLMLHI